MASIHLGLDSPELTNSVLYAAAIGAFLLSVLGRPHFGLYFILPLLPLQTVRYRMHQMPLGAQLVDIILLGVILGLWRQRATLTPQTRLTKLIFVFAVFSYLSLWIGAVYLDTSWPIGISDPRFSDWKNYMVIFLLFFLVFAAIQTPRQMKTLLVLMCISVLILNRAYMNEISGRDFSAFSDSIRDEGPMGYCGVNGFAAFQAQIGVFLIALLSMQKKWIPRLACALVLGTCLYTLTFSLSRGGYMALIAGAFFIGLIKDRKILVILVVFLCSWQVLVPGAVRERVFMTKSADGELDHSAGVRLNLWEDAAQTFRTDPVFGTGIFTYMYGTHLGEYRDTHNLYVKIALETGVFGLFLFLAMFRQFFVLGWSLFRDDSVDDFARSIGFGVAGLVIAALVANVFGDRWTYIEISGYTCALVAMACRLHMISQQRELGSANDDTEETEGHQVLLGGSQPFSQPGFLI